MRLKQLFSVKNELYIFGLLTLILVIPAFFINLGITPVIEDEAIRGLVALEMDVSHQYFVPTVGGSDYYNKPPLFNWLVLLFFKAGGYNELMLRIPVVISLLLFALTIFLTVRKHLGNRVAFISAIAFITCGRIITYESLKGLIDIIFSWVLFVNFIVLYNGFRKQKFLQTFILSYLLLFVAFMLKGIPALVFQGFTVIALLYIQFRWKMFPFLFSYKHIAGGLIFILLTVVYYFTYNHYNPGTLDELISVTLQQSTRRTAIKFGAGSTILHLLTYPFEFIGHFLPWTLLLIYFFKKGSKKIFTNPFITSSFWVFLLNITIYWSSPESFARYVLMLVPLLYVVLIYLYENNQSWNTGKVLYYIFFTFILLGFLATFSIPFMKITNVRSFVFLKTLFLMFSLGLIAFFYFKQPRNMLIYTGLFLLVVRIGFDWFVLTDRLKDGNYVQRRAEAKEIGKFARNHEVYVYGEPFKDFNEDTRIKYVSFFTRFYMSAEAHKIIRDSNTIKSGSYYLVRPKDVQGKTYIKYAEIRVTKDTEPRYLVQFK